MHTHKNGSCLEISEILNYGIWTFPIEEFAYELEDKLPKIIIAVLHNSQ